MKKMLLAMALATAVVLSAGPAGAAVAVQSSQAQADHGYTRWAVYSSDQECQSAGFFGLGIGDWNDFFCTSVPFEGVELWVHFPEPDPGPTPGQTVYIQGTSGKCVDVQWGNSGNGTPLQLWTCGSNNQAQRWTLHSDGSIRAFGKCMDVRNRSTSNGAIIHIWDCHGGANQIWESINVNGNTRMLRNPVSGRCLDAYASGTANGTRIQLWDCVTASSGQQWTFIPPF